MTRRVVDTSAPITDSQLAALLSATPPVAGVIRTISHNPGFEVDNLKPAEVARIEAKVPLLGAYAMYRAIGWGRDAGVYDGTRDATNALIVLKPRHFLAVDLEGDATREQWFAHAMAWLDTTKYLVTQSIIRRRVVYVAGNAAERLTTADLDAIAEAHPDVVFWTAYSAATRKTAGCSEPTRGWGMTQGGKIMLGGAEFDDGEADESMFEGTQASPTAVTLPAPADPAITWSRLPGETNGTFLARVARHYSGDSAKVNCAELAALLSRGGVDDPNKAVDLATNCATWACSVLYACGLRGPVAKSFFGANGQSLGDSLSRLVFGYPGAYVPFDGKSVPPVGAVLHWGTPGKNNDHEGIVDDSPSGGDLIVHANHPDIETTEAGGSNNSVNTGTHTPPYYSWGRPLRGWLDPEKLDLAPFVPVPSPTFEPSPDAPTTPALPSSPDVATSSTSSTASPPKTLPTLRQTARHSPSGYAGAALAAVLGLAQRHPYWTAAAVVVLLVLAVEAVLVERRRRTSAADLARMIAMLKANSAKATAALAAHTPKD